MKKLTKTFALAFAALAFASCSKTGAGDNIGSGEKKGSSTYAMFKFNIAEGGRAVDFDPTTTPDQDAADAKLGRLQLLIFNNVTKALEVNEIISTASKTVLLTSGKKKIFVIANSDNLTDYNTAISPTTFKPGEAGTTLTEFSALNFVAGTPQAIGASNPRTFDFSKLYSPSVVSPAAGLPMSNTNEITYTLTPGVSEVDAAAGMPTNAGTSSSNTFNIQLYYMVAKARLILGAGVLKVGDVAAKEPKISDVSYSIRNLALKTNYVQNVPVAGNPQSFYYGQEFANQDAYDLQFDYASNIVVSSTTTPGNYLYVPENNNNAALTRGQSSYFAIKASFEPVVINKVEYDINTVVKYTYAALVTADPMNKKYIYTLRDVQGIPNGSYFSDLSKLQEAAWIKVNGKAFSEGDRTAAADLIVANDYTSFSGGISYYRVDLGKGTGTNTQYGVLRSNKYDATINQITGPGVPKEEDLTNDPTDPVSAKTYISATILPAVWTPVTQSADL